MKKNRIVALILILTMALPLCVSAAPTAENALQVIPFNPVNTDAATSSSIGQHQYRICFQDGLKVNSYGVSYNLSLLSNSIEQVVFRVGDGANSITVGYYFGNAPYSWADMIQALSAKLEELRKRGFDAINGGSAPACSLENLVLSYVDVHYENSSERDFAKMIPTLYGVSEYVETDGFRGNLSDKSATPCDNFTPKTLSSTIDGSYHHKVGSTIKWYNHLSGEDTTCGANLSEPHKGDGNNRWESGFNWFPNFVSVGFDIDSPAGKIRLN